MSKQVMQRALEAFVWNLNTDLDNIPACEQWAKMLKKNISDLTEALQALEQNQVPSAWRYKDSGRICDNSDKRMTAPPDWVPLYTAPTARQWVGLTDGEIDVGLCRSPYALQTAQAWRDGVEWAQEQLKEKNT